MTPEQFAALQREFLIRTDKRSALLLLAEFDDLKAEIARFLSNNPVEAIRAANLNSQTFLDAMRLLFEKKIDDMSISFQRIVQSAQQRNVKFVADRMRKYLSLEAKSFSIDREAIQKLFGRMQNGSTLSKFFQRLKQPVANRAKAEMLESFALGESNRSIAKRLNDVADIGLARAMTISRTESNEAYRAASREFYAEADIKEYVWMSRLSATTCLICWHLHGRKFKSSVKVFSHPNCVCCLIPLTKNQPEIITGAEKFARLEIGFQKQILGGKRFELFRDGAKLEDFVGVKSSDEFGEQHFIKPLSDME